MPNVCEDWNVKCVFNDKKYESAKLFFVGSGGLRANCGSLSGQLTPFFHDGHEYNVFFLSCVYNW